MRSKREAMKRWMDPTTCLLELLSIEEKEEMRWDCRLMQKKYNITTAKKNYTLNQHKTTDFCVNCYNIALLRTDVVEV